MDNVLTGVETLSEALEYYTSSRNCFQKAGMNLRQWTSNSPALNRLAHDDRVYTEPELKHKHRYSLTFINKTDQGNQQHRKSLQKISIKLILKSLRPVGVCGTSHSKSQDNAGTMETQPNRNKELPDSFKENWIKWLNELQSLTTLEIPRQYFNTVASEVQLHVFCDSS